MPKIYKGSCRYKTVIYRNPGVEYVPIVSFNIPDMKPEDAADKLNQYGFCPESRSSLFSACSLFSWYAGRDCKICSVCF